MRRRSVRVPPPRSSFAGFRFPPEVITVAVRWSLRYALSYRDVEELLAERGITVDHVTIHRWVQRFTPLLIDVARPCRHTPRGSLVRRRNRCQGRRAVGLPVPRDRPVRAGHRRARLREADLAATRRFSTRAREHRPHPREVSTDQAPAYPRAVDDLLPAARHIMKRHANNPIESDHGRLTARLRPMRRLQQLRSVRVTSTGHAFAQNLRSGHNELGVDTDPKHRLPAVFTEPAPAISTPHQRGAHHACLPSMQQSPPSASRPSRPTRRRHSPR
jgi:transposase-like protein